MRSLILWGVICLSFMLLSACAPAPEPEPEAAAEAVFDQAAEEEAIRKVIQEGISAHNNHDAKGVVVFLDEVYENLDGSRKGPGAFEETYAEQFNRAKDLKYQELQYVRTVFVTPDVAIYKSVGEFSGQVDEDGNNLPPSKVTRIHLVVKRNGNWLRAARFNIPIEE